MLLGDIREARERTLSELADMAEQEFERPTSMERWDDARRVLLRFGDHMREHANQAVAARANTGHGPTMPQRMLMEAELAWGKLLGATVGLDDDAIRKTPPDGGWSVEQVLEHVLRVERLYLDAIAEARAGLGTQTDNQ
jgi:hypothetical protein